MLRPGLLLPLAVSLSAVLLIVTGALAAGSGRAGAWQWAQATIEVLAAVECARTARRLMGRARLVWALFAAGLTVWAITDLAYGLVRLRGVAVPEVSPFDVGWLLFFVPMLVGVFFLYGSLRPERGWQGALDGLLIGLASGLLAWTFLLRPQMAGGQGAGLMAIDLLYPALDLVALCALAWLVIRRRSRAPSWLWWIVAAFGLQAGADLVYLVFALGDGAALAGLSATLYAAGGMLWVGAARSRRRHPQRTLSPGRRDAPPGWSRALPFVLAAGVEALALFGHRTPVVSAVAMVAAALVTMRVLAGIRVDQGILVERNRLLMSDPLTGAHNRRFFEQALERAMARSLRADEPLALIAIDLDRFKQVNDSLGHGAGDEFLVRLVTELGAGLRREDMLCRLGGDEFVVLAPGVDAETARRMAVRMGATVRQTAAAVVPEIGVSASLGVACAPNDAVSPQELLRWADQAAYEAKATGRDRTVVHSLAGMRVDV